MSQYKSNYTGKQTDNSQRVINEITDALSHIGQSGEVNAEDVRIKGSKIDGSINQAIYASNYIDGGSIDTKFNEIDDSISDINDAINNISTGVSTIYLKDFNAIGYTEPADDFNGNISQYCSSFPFGKKIVFTPTSDFITTYPKLSAYLMINGGNTGSSASSDIFGSLLQYSIISWESLNENLSSFPRKYVTQYSVSGIGDNNSGINAERINYACRYSGTQTYQVEIRDFKWHLKNEIFMFQGNSASIALGLDNTPILRAISNDIVNWQPTNLSNIYLKCIVDDTDYSTTHLIPLNPYGFNGGAFLKSGASYVIWTSDPNNINNPKYTTILLLYNSGTSRYTLSISNRSITSATIVGF